MSAEPNKPYREIDFGRIQNFKAQEILQKTGVRVNRAKKILSSFEIVHAFRNHGDAVKEAKRTPPQKGIVAADFEFIPGILSDFDYIQYGGRNGKGKDVIVFVKKIKGMLYHVVMASSGAFEGANLYFNTMYVIK
jgi:hypothetical protein